jgi:uncharacterized membrane protein YgcG
VPGQQIYDQAALLSPAEVSDLETRAAAVARAGAPMVVYLRVRDASYDQTLQDARDLMEAWSVQSAPGARDGVVIFLNLTPSDHRHGQVALYAGQQQVDGGHLPQAELQRIYAQVMLPRLMAGETAAGIGAGLDAIQHDLIYGPPPAPPPSPFAQAVAFFVGLPLVGLAALVAVLVAVLMLRARRPKPPFPPSGDTTPPSDLAPALVGALVRGRVGDQQMVATLLDLARRGILAIEPAGRAGLRKAQVRIQDHAPQLAGYEASVFASVSAVASAEGVVLPRKLGQIRSRWNPAKALLRAELLARGWCDPTAGARRRPLYVVATVALLSALVGVVGVGIGTTPLGLVGSAILLAAAIVAYSVAGGMPETSWAGEEEAAPWRAYLAALKALPHAAVPAGDLAAVLDVAVPYAVAAGIIGALTRLLKAAGRQGYAPAWFGRAGGAIGDDFYPVWAAFVAATAPSSASDGGAGGAAAGGAGAGGGF